MGSGREKSSVGRQNSFGESSVHSSDPAWLWWSPKFMPRWGHGCVAPAAGDAGGYLAHQQRSGMSSDTEQLAVRNLAVSAPLFKSEASAAGPALKLSEILGNPKPYQGVEAGGRSGLSNLNLLNPGASWL